MSLSRLYPSAPFEHFFGDFPRMHGPYPFGSLEETHTSRAMQPKYLSLTTLVSLVECLIVDPCDLGWTCTSTPTRTS